MAPTVPSANSVTRHTVGAAVGEGAITAGPSGFLPDRSDQAKPLLRRHRLRVVAGQVDAILHHHDIRGAELAHIDGHANWLSAIGAETLILSAIPQRAGSGAIFSRGTSSGVSPSSHFTV